MIQGLAERLKKLREKYHYSQQLNISPSIVSGYETGERTPSAEKLLALSSLYHCSTDYLLGRTSENPETIIPVDHLNPDQINALLHLISSMNS